MLIYLVPELIEFGREHHPETMIEKPERSFFQLVRDGAGLPTRKARWCCRLLKEPGGENRRVVLGVRASESTNRKNRPIINRCARGNKTYINPIISWSSNDVWTYIKRRGIPYCSLYDEGFKRLGCVFCPFEARVNLQKSRWPKLFNALSIAVGKAYDIGKPIWLKKFQSPDDVLDWWFSRNRSMPDDGDEQMIFDQFDDD